MSQSSVEAAAEPIVEAIDKVAHALLDKVLEKAGGLFDAAATGPQASLRDDLLGRLAEALMQRLLAHTHAALAIASIATAPAPSSPSPSSAAHDPAPEPPPSLDPLPPVEPVEPAAMDPSEMLAIEEARELNRLSEVVIEKVMSQVNPLLIELAKLVPAKSVGNADDLLTSALAMQKRAAEKALMSLNDRVLSAQQRFMKPR